MSFVFISCQKEKPVNMGFKNGMFSPCAETSCFSTTDPDSTKKIDALKFSDSAEKAISDMKKYAMLLGDAQIITEEGGYLHIIYKGLLNTDDLEVFVNQNKGVIEYKTSARGSFDFGSNKSRAHDLAFKYIQRGL